MKASFGSARGPFHSEEASQLASRYVRRLVSHIVSQLCDSRARTANMLAKRVQHQPKHTKTVYHAEGCVWWEGVGSCPVSAMWDTLTSGREIDMNLRKPPRSLCGHFL